MKTVKQYGLGATSLAMPIIAVVHCLTLYFISNNILLPLFEIDTESVEGRATSVCCSFGNSGVVPLIFAETLFRDQGGDLLQKASSQISLFLLGWSPLFWSFGRNALLGGLANKSLQDDEKEMPTLFEKIQSWKRLFPPPVVGVFIGLILSIPFLRNLFMSYSHEGIKKIAPLQVVFNCCQNLGRACSPLALLVLTSSLALGNTKPVTATKQSSQKVDEIPFLKRWCCVSLARFVLSPCLMIALLTILEKKNLIGSIRSQDAMSWFILILQASMPPAQNSVLMLQVSEQTDEASRLTKFLFSIYATSMIPVVLVSTILLEKCNFITS